MVFNFFDHKVESRAKLQIVVIDTQTIKQELKLFLHINWFLFKNWIVTKHSFFNFKKDVVE